MFGQRAPFSVPPACQCAKSSSYCFSGGARGGFNKGKAPRYASGAVVIIFNLYLRKGCQTWYSTRSLVMSDKNNHAVHNNVGDILVCVLNNTGRYLCPL